MSAAAAMILSGRVTFRETPRPERDPVRYWYPCYQEWLSLNEVTYLKNHVLYNVRIYPAIGEVMISICGKS